MSKSLAGTILAYKGNLYDYNYKESIQCLLEFCDHVIVAAGGGDGTLDSVIELASQNIDRVTIIPITKEHWDSQHGSDKLNYFSNLAIAESQRLGYEYQFNLQSDEIVHEKSYAAIRQAVNNGCESYFCTRVNLWGDCYHKLVVPLNRMPCSTSIIRLAKTYCRSVGDAESLGVSLVDSYFHDDIIIFHYGFVRKKEVMKSKIINMQCNIFKMEHYDQKLNESEVFNSKLWFDGDDLAVIDYPHPKIMKEWIKSRP